MSEEFDLLVISPHQFKKSLLKLIEHKEKLDIRTKLVELKKIYSSYYFSSEGRDKPEKIKYFIKNAYDKWNVRYVLLVGGDKELPVRYIHNFAYYPPYYIFPRYKVIEPPYISDLYYADIYDEEGNFSTWDSNNNNIFGEWIGKSAEDKNIDLRPEVAIGRLPCKREVEVNIMVNKIIRYELNNNDKEWFKNMVVAAGDTYPKNDNIYEGELDVIEAISYMKDFNHVKFLTSDNSLGVNDTYKIINAINKGCGFLYMAGHGNPQLWHTHLPNNSDLAAIFHLKFIKKLRNRDKLPVCVVNGCRNSAFDTHPIYFFKNPIKSLYWGNYLYKVWMWAITCSSEGGCIASLGGTGLGHIKYDEETGGKADAWSFLSPQFFYEYGVKKNDIIGDIWKNLILRYLDKFKIDWDTPSLIFKSDEPKPDVINARTVQQFILFGDPTLKIGGYEGII